MSSEYQLRKTISNQLNYAGVLPDGRIDSEITVLFRGTSPCTTLFRGIFFWTGQQQR